MKIIFLQMSTQEMQDFDFKFNFIVYYLPLIFAILCVIIAILNERTSFKKGKIKYYKFKFFNDREVRVNTIKALKYSTSQKIINHSTLLTSTSRMFYKIETLTGEEFFINETNIVEIIPIYENN